MEDVLCKIDVEEDSKCKGCCRYCEDTCNHKCIFAKFNQECGNEVHRIISPLEAIKRRKYEQ